MTNNLKAIRKTKGFTLERLAEATGLALSTINNFENGRHGISSEKLEVIARILEVSTQDILEQPGGASIKEEDSGYNAPDGNLSARIALAKQSLRPFIESLSANQILQHMRTVGKDETMPLPHRLSQMLAVIELLLERDRTSAARQPRHKGPLTSSEARASGGDVQEELAAAIADLPPDVARTALEKLRKVGEAHVAKHKKQDPKPPSQ